MRYRAIGAAVLLILLGLFGIYLSHRAPAVSVTANSADLDTDENALEQETYAAAAASAVSAPEVKYRISSSTPQFVILSFDGSRSVEMLNETLAFEQKMQSVGKPLHFTYFINAAYFLTDDNAKLYQPSAEPMGTSKVGFSSTTADIALRVKGFNAAFAAGNEIGSHSAGHFNGSDWNYDQWKQEFASFASLMSNVRQNNLSQKIDAPIFLTGIRGFRAPNLGVNKILYKVLGDLDFTYDASGVSLTDAWPHRDSYRIWHIPLGTVNMGAGDRPVIAMDYNLYVHQSGAKDVAVKGTPLWDSYLNEAKTAYMDYFNKNYNGNRGPVSIADHFSKWNDGLYWEAMKAFAENVCGKPQVRCVTFKELVDYLNAVGVPPMIK